MLNALIVRGVGAPTTFWASLEKNSSPFLKNIFLCIKIISNKRRNWIWQRFTCLWFLSQYFELLPTTSSTTYLTASLQLSLLTSTDNSPSLMAIFLSCNKHEPWMSSFICLWFSMFRQCAWTPTGSERAQTESIWSLLKNYMPICDLVLIFCHVSLCINFTNYIHW